MKSRTDKEQDRVNALKIARTAIRLKHMINADIEMNERLPELERQISELQAQGQAWQLDSNTLSVRGVLDA